MLTKHHLRLLTNSDHVALLAVQLLVLMCSEVSVVEIEVSSSLIQRMLNNGLGTMKVSETFANPEEIFDDMQTLPD